MSDEPTGLVIPADDPRAVELTAAVHSGDIDTIRRLLSEDPRLARAWITDSTGFRTPLHLVADWPGYFPNGPQIVRLLIGAGADPSFRHPARCDETALHWAASSDDVEVAAAPDRWRRGWLGSAPGLGQVTDAGLAAIVRGDQRNQPRPGRAVSILT